MTMNILTRAFFDELEKMISESSETLSDEEITKKIEDIIPEIVPRLAKSIKESLMKNSAAMLIERRNLFTEFGNRNLKRWKPAFDLLETFIVICTEAGENFNNSYRPRAIEKNDIVFDIVIRHHARACHISQEILCLLIL